MFEEKNVLVVVLVYFPTRYMDYPHASQPSAVYLFEYLSGRWTKWYNRSHIVVLAKTGVGV
jgi:hypothetical protein